MSGKHYNTARAGVPAGFGATQAPPRIITFPVRPPRAAQPPQPDPALSVRGRRSDWKPYDGPNHALQWLAACSFSGELVRVEVLERARGVNVIFRNGAGVSMCQQGTRVVWDPPSAQEPPLCCRECGQRYRAGYIAGRERPAAMNYQRRSGSCPR